MRVLVVTNMYPPHHYGGYELLCRDAVDAFRRSGHEVTVLTGDLRRADREDDPAPGEVRRELRLYWRDFEIVRPGLRERLARERHNQDVLDAAITDVAPDVVSFWNMGAVSMGILTSVVERPVPSVLVMCDDWLVYGPLVDPWARMWERVPAGAGLGRRIFGVPTKIADLDRTTACFISECTRRTARDNTRWTFPRSTVTHSGVARSDFPPPRAEEEAGPWRGRLLYVGRVEPRKGVATAVRALAQLPSDHVLDVVGPDEGGHVAEVGRLAGSLGVAEQVRFGEEARHRLRARYLDADAVVFPSEWEEPFGVVPLEAMACGRPVVATGTGGSDEYLEDGVNCLRFPAGDERALATAVQRLAGDGGLRRRLVEGGFATAAHFDVDRVNAVLEEWHVATAEGFSGGAPGPTGPVRTRPQET